MPNGTMILAGRSSGTIYAGRASAPITVGQLQVPSITAPAWRAGGACLPIPQCCCKGPVTVSPGETRLIMLNWASEVDSTEPPFAVYSVDEASLYDMSESPPVPANPDVIKISTGIGGTDPPVIDNSDAASLVKIRPPYGTNLMITVAPDAMIGKQYKLTICVLACSGCDPGKSRWCDCVVLRVAEC